MKLKYLKDMPFKASQWRLKKSLQASSHSLKVALLDCGRGGAATMQTCCILLLLGSCIV